MGVSDRTASDGMLYDQWGAEGLAYLNSTASLQKMAEDLGTSRYDTVLMVAARAKENAYQNAEEQPGYIGNSFGGDMGMGMRRPPPARSQVVTAVEELLAQVGETGEMPELVTPGIPQEILDEWAEEEAAEAAAAEAAALADGVEEEEFDDDLLDELFGDDLGLPAEDVDASASAGAKAEEDDDDEEADEEDDLLADLMGDLKGGGEASSSAAEEDDADDDGDLFGDDLLDDEDDDEDGMADLFAALGEDSVEAGGMSPGDRG